MKRHALMLSLVLVGALSGVAKAQEVCTDKPIYCEPGYRLVQEIGYKEVEHACCKVVPNKRTKWVYCSKPDYFCVSHCPHCRDRCGDDCGGCCQSCGSCKGPYCRQALLKKQVECVYGTKCVVEIVKEKVPCVYWRKVPCGPEALPAPMSTPAPMPAASPMTSTTMPMNMPAMPTDSSPVTVEVVK